MTGLHPLTVTLWSFMRKTSTSTLDPSEEEDVDAAAASCCAPSKNPLKGTERRTAGVCAAHWTNRSRAARRSST